MTNAGGILSTWIFTGAPRYHKACVINLTFSIGIVLAALGNVGYLAWRNLQKQRVLQGIGAMQGVGSGEDAERKRLGDQHPAFVYTL